MHAVERQSSFRATEHPQSTAAQGDGGAATSAKRAPTPVRFYIARSFPPIEPQPRARVPRESLGQAGTLEAPWLA
jgi:hypothetical protein